MGFTCGAAVGHDETYLNERGELRGESVARIAFLRQILVQLPAKRLQPTLKVDPLTLEPISRLRGNLPPEAHEIVEGPGHVEAAGYCDQECYLFYYGMYQPGSRNFNLPAGRDDVFVVGFDGSDGADDIYDRLPPPKGTPAHGTGFAASAMHGCPLNNKSFKYTDIQTHARSCRW